MERTVRNFGTSFWTKVIGVRVGVEGGWIDPKELLTKFLEGFFI